MKTRIVKPKSRAHYALFASATPFKPKVVKNRKKYTRKTKHKGV